MVGDNQLRNVSRALPCGISSQARCLPDLDGRPFRVASSQGAKITDEHGAEYIDYAMGMGATILGHAHPEVVSALREALDNGPMPGFQHSSEEAAAEALTARTGWLTQATFVNTGSEAVHLACRIARTRTGRPLIAKMAAGYDGWYDDVAVGLNGSPEANWSGERPVFPGGVTLLRYNDLDDAEALFSERSDVAAVVVEPVLANAGCIEPVAEYLRDLASLARRHGALVIADEVLTGLRFHAGLTSQAQGWDPDLATMGKAIGSGFPVAAVLGTPEAFVTIVDGSAVRAGTYNGNPLAAAAVLSTMAALEGVDYGSMLTRGRQLRQGILETFADVGVTLSTSGLDSVFSLWFAATPPRCYAEAIPSADVERAHALHLALRREGVLVMPSPWGRLFMSFSHGEDEIAATLERLRRAVKRV